VIAIQTRKNGVIVTVGRDALAQAAARMAQRMGCRKEAQGCLRPGEGLKLADRIASRFQFQQMPRSVCWHSNIVDIDPRARLQVVSPILREVAAPDAPLLDPVVTSGTGNNLTVTLKAASNLVGYEKAWYQARRKGQWTGFVIVPLSADGMWKAGSNPGPNRRTNYVFQFPADARHFYRLVYKRSRTSLPALVIAARTRAELDRRATALETGVASCEKLNGELCITIRTGCREPAIARHRQRARRSCRDGGARGRGNPRAGERRPEVVLT